MAQTATNPKIEELRFRLKTDPKSRLFYQLAEELRKSGSLDEAEQILRNGLNVYPTYLAAWVSLGRVLRDRKDDGAAVEALSRAMQLDPGNVVAARLLADAYLNLGDNVEAIKKYKLVHALMPGDEELKATIEQLDREISGPPIAIQPVEEVFAPAPAEVSQPEDVEVAFPNQEEPAFPSDAEFAVPSQDVVAAQDAPIEESLFDRTAPPFDEAVETGDVEPMLLGHDESPFEEPASIASSIEIEQPMGMHIESAPLMAEVPAPVIDDPDVFESAPESPQPPAEGLTDTPTMADLYARQGLTNDARHIYENILARDPANHDVRAKLEAITPDVNPKIERLERWLARVSKREVAGV
jgi:Tfp pilus assembly protein PilF